MLPKLIFPGSSYSLPAGMLRKAESHLAVYSQLKDRPELSEHSLGPRQRSMQMLGDKKNRSVM